MSRKVFFEGLRDGVPIGLGYFAVAFSLGIVARNAGLTPIQGFIASFFNLASAGEYALFTSMQAAASFLEIAIITLVVNARYLLMSCALAQRFDPATPMIHRFL
jgi:predicted branched-subunit amino acid permease